MTIRFMMSICNVPITMVYATSITNTMLITDLGMLVSSLSYALILGSASVNDQYFMHHKPTMAEHGYTWMCIVKQAKEVHIDEYVEEMFSMYKKKSALTDK